MLFRVEAGRIALPSRDPSTAASTCVVDNLKFHSSSPLSTGYSRSYPKTLFSSRRVGHDRERSGIVNQLSGDSGSHPQSGLPFLRQPVRGFPRQIIFGQLFTWPTDQPRHATDASSNPVEPNSPPIDQRTVLATSS